MARQPEFLTEQQRALGRYLRALREAANLYQADIARAVPCDRTTVTHAEAGSQLPASDFWEKADQLVGATGALIARYDELVDARTAYLAEQQAKRRTQAQATVEQLTAGPSVKSEQAGHGGSDDDSPAAPTGEYARQRRKTLKLGLAAVLTPEILSRVLADAADEAMEFTQAAAVSAVGQGTLEHLELVISDLNQDYSKNPPAERFIVARFYRSRVNELIRGRHTLKELQALYVCAAWLSELLAWLAHDLGNSRTAQAFALDCYTYADEVGHGELCGWAADAMASITMYSERPHNAVRAAMRGATKVPGGHPLAVRLRAQAARAHARLGQREPCETLFGEAQRLHERLPARAPSRFTIDTGTLASYAMTAYPASAYAWLGDFRTARDHAEAALVVHESVPSASKSPSREAIARLDLATAIAQLGSPDEAVVLGSQALTSTRVVTSVLLRAGDLTKVLVNRYPKLACVREFHEHYLHIAQRVAKEHGS
ncbi:MAG: helix-turn-helix domain-containing protein [Pseudonocardiaceae bacterium]